MQKSLLCLFLLMAFAFVTHSQSPQAAPPSSVASASVSSFTSAPPNNWSCTFNFFNNGRQVYSNTARLSQPSTTRGSLSGSNDNNIDSFSWSGTRCFCWVVVYQTSNWRGLNLGLWTDSTRGSYDLSKYITFDMNDRRWEPWDTTVSSYAIYCY